MIVSDEIVQNFFERRFFITQYKDSLKTICWWSGGVTSAVACKLALDMFDVNYIIFIDTKNEHEDTYRFKEDCEKWYGKKIEVVSFVGDKKKYRSIQDVWYKFNSLNVATGAICSTELKRKMREVIQKMIPFNHQVFGYEFDKKEMNRALSMAKNNPDAKPVFPLLAMGYDKEKCIQVVMEAGIEVPESYRLGFSNNNCLGTGCVQGGIGYWQKIREDFPDKFDKMAEVEHELTAIKGKPVTMLKDQSNEAKEKPKGHELVFLKKHPHYPHLKELSDFPKQEVKPLMECNGFCGTNDLNPRNTTELELNFEL